MAGERGRDRLRSQDKQATGCDGCQRWRAPGVGREAGQAVTEDMLRLRGEWWSLRQSSGSESL